MMSSLDPTPTAYVLLGIHPSAPWELVDAAYWWGAIALQDQRAVDRDADVALHRITRAFENLADARRRAAYDVTIGYREEPLVSRQFLKSRQSVFSRIFRRRSATLPAIDYYEVIGLDEFAPANWIPEARRIMRDHYRNVPDDSRRALLLSLLDEASDVLSDVRTRAQYDEERRRKAPQVRQRPGVDSDTVGATPVDDPGPRGETRLPEGPAEPPDKPPTSATRIAPQVQPRKTESSARTASGDDSSQKPPNTESEANIEPGPTIEPGLPPRRRALLSLVVRRAGAGTTRLGRAVAVIGRAAAGLIRGAASSVAALFRNKLRKRASGPPSYPAWERRAGGFPEIQPAIDEEPSAWLELATGEKYALGKGPVTIGYTPDCEIGLPGGSGGGDARARIWRRDGRYMLHNLSPLIDVVIAGKPATWVILEDGDDIVLGQQKIIFRDPRAGAG